LPPSLPAVDINEQSRVESDVASIYAGVGVHQAVGMNHLSTRIAQDGELAIYNGLPDKERLHTVVNADRDQARVKRLELLRVPRELAQLAAAVRSPVAAIKKQEHALSAQRGEAKRLAVLVLQCDVRDWLTLSGSDLRLRQNLLGGSEQREQQKFDHSSSPSPQHGGGLYRNLAGGKVERCNVPLTSRDLCA